MVDLLCYLLFSLVHVHGAQHSVEPPRNNLKIIGFIILVLNYLKNEAYCISYYIIIITITVIVNIIISLLLSL